METWMRISLLLCVYGFFREFRPSDSFLTDFLSGEWRNETAEEVTKEVYPYATYAYLSQLVVAFLITDMLRYKPLIVVSACFGIVIWVMLLWTKSLGALQVVARKMSLPMRRFLTEGAELLHQDSNSMDRIMMYLEDSLQTLNAELNEVNFERFLDAIWTELAFILKQLVQNNIDRRRPPLFFANLRETLQLMVKSFKGTQCNKDKASSDKETLEEIFNLLELHGYETSDLIHQYYLEQIKHHEKIPDSRYGQLTVRCWFEDNNLVIDVMNARNLAPMDSNGPCDPFVRIQIIPEEKFNNVTKIKTKEQDKTLFPLFDEKFSIPLTPEQKAMRNAVVMFSVKDKDLFGYSNQYIAECYVVFQNIPDDYSDQFHLKLIRPTCTSSECIHALEYRQGDKQAKDFVKKLRQKMNSTE